MPATDLIEVHDNAISPQDCAAIVARFEADGGAMPGRIGSGLFPELKDSRDITLEGKPHWQDVQDLLMGAALRATVAYLRRYPYMMIAPLMLQYGNPPRRLDAQDITHMDEATLTSMVQNVLRPVKLNRMTGIRAALETGNNIIIRCQDVNNLTLSLISPLAALSR